MYRNFKPICDSMPAMSFLFRNIVIRKGMGEGRSFLATGRRPRGGLFTCILIRSTRLCNFGMRPNGHLSDCFHWVSTMFDREIEAKRGHISD